jgi:hypothetical protein
MAGETTIKQILRFLAPGQRDVANLCRWPPDAFAIAAYILHKTGAYRVLVTEDYWGDEESSDWLQTINYVASQWKVTAPGSLPPPAKIRKWWDVVLAKRDFPLRAVYGDRDLCRALLDLCAAADQACAGIGIPAPGTADSDDSFAQVANDLLAWTFLTGEDSSTLCRSIDPRLLAVLPKLHTPQTGMTLRSLTHNLALCEVGEVSARWASVPTRLAEEGSRYGLNLLLVPWPTKVSPLQFHAVANDRCGRHRFGEGNAYFRFEGDVSDQEPTLQKFEDLVRDATERVGRIDGVILPELSVPSEAVYKHLYERMIAVNPEAFLVAGVGIAAAEPDKEGVNCVMYTMPLFPGFRFTFTQNKHHRWRIDAAQIQQYGMAHRLDPSVSWWEHIKLSSRGVSFFSAAPWLTFCFLVCEDLARQDPIANLLRSIGPNLVIALLMDGPQLKNRWPARYATVLADDPGSSVLTMTSIGMCLQSRRRVECDEAPSRIIALWKDGKSEAREINLEPHSEGVILTLVRRYENEYTADGREDGMATAYLTLCDVIQVPQRTTPSDP